MSRNGSGTYTLPAGNPVVTGTTISSTWANNTLTDIATALTGSLSADGQTTATGALQMGSNKITGLANGTVSTDAATISQVTTNVAITGGSIDGTTIGTTTRADGKFTTLAANGDVSLTSTGFLAIPSGTTAQRPVSPVNSEMRYNTTTNQFEGYANSAWSSFGGSAAGSNTQIQYNNSGSLGASSALTFDGTNLTVPKIVFATSNTPSLTNYQGGALTSGTVVASTSGTSIDFTSIPSWVKRITVMYQGISTTGSSVIIVQLGTSGGVQTSSYVGSSWESNTINTTYSAGFAIGTSNTASSAWSGIGTICLQNSSTNNWIWSNVAGDSAGGNTSQGGGYKTLSASLTTVRLTITNGTDTFDAGSVNILYE
jgi:hypothetical protein